MRKTNSDLALIKMPELCKRLCRSKSSIYRDVRRGAFPKPIKTGLRSVAWVVTEVEAWQDRKILERE